VIQSIRNIFEHNTRLLGEMDKAIYYFRGQQIDMALGHMAKSIDEVRISIETIISNRDYFNVVDTESMLEMLKGILEAKKNKDFILLADLLELQLINFLIGVQELIISKEEIDFNEENYRDNIEVILNHSEGLEDSLREPIDTAKLLESGYRVEFTSCGLMTLAAENDGCQFYFHTNSKIQTEAFLLAKQWFQRERKHYHIYGFGMGYHIRELLALDPLAQITVYESDADVIKLACAFTDMKNVFHSHKVKVIFDPKFARMDEMLSNPEKEGDLLVHYPSYKNIKENKGRELLASGLPWLETIEA